MNTCSLSILIRESQTKRSTGFRSRQINTSNAMCNSNERFTDWNGNVYRSFGEKLKSEGNQVLSLCEGTKSIFFEDLNFVNANEEDMTEGKARSILFEALFE